MYEQQPPQQPQPVKRLAIWQVVLILVVLAFAAWYVYTQLAPVTSPYGTITSGALRASYDGDCLIVRDEVPYDSETVTKINYRVQEGATISAGIAICDVYSSGFSTKETSTLQGYRDQIRDYQVSLIASQTTYDSRMDRLNTDVIDLALELRGMIRSGTGNLMNQERLLTTAIEMRQDYLREKFTSDQRLSRLYDDEESQQQRIESWTKTYSTNHPCFVSFYSDGYEYGLTNETYADFTPGQVRAMFNGARPVSISGARTTIYRTINDGAWYVLFLTKSASEWTPMEGQVYELKLELFEKKIYRATVVSFSRTGGELLVRLRIDGDVRDVLYTRACTAVLGENVQYLCVPKRAIYTQNNQQGVVVVADGRNIFIPVNVVMQDGEDVYISAVQQGFLYEGQTVLLF